MRTHTLPRLLVAAALAVAVLAPLSAAGAEASPRLGVLLVDHGEPPEYNELTYESFRKFFDHLIEMGLIPAWVKLIDSGTVTQDRGCFDCPAPSGEPELIDAWLRPQGRAGVYVPASDNAPAHYVVPGGPGLGEPDVFEHVGLTAWQEWEVMGGRSPNYDQKLPKKLAVVERLRERYGDDLPVAIGYGIDPRIDGKRRDVRVAVEELVDAGAEHLVVAYHGVGFSDVMQTHMLRHEIHEILDEIAPGVTVSYTAPLGTTDRYVDAVVAKALAELRRLPRSARVAIHLSGHGLPTGKCGDYDCGADAYHEVARSLFERTSAAILDAAARPGLGVFHVYGDGGEGDDDPDDEVDSPLEALAERQTAGFTHVVDIPYEFDSDSRDTLIVLRSGYGRPEGEWDRRFESRFRHDGMRVTITNSSFGAGAKTDAYENVIVAEIERVWSQVAAPDHH
ncbi:MAG TPA: hypothetical protein VG318_16945 [Actinomycetota bacterium]|nr:hypothetical protein [Actinomycetota bacterium]